MKIFHPRSDGGLILKSDSSGVALVAAGVEEFQDFSHGRCDDEVLVQLAALRSLEEQGLAEVLANGYYIDEDIAVQLDRETRELLGLPPPWPGFFRLTAEGQTSSDEFRIRFGAHLASGEEIGKYNLKGPLLRFSESEVYLPDAAQWRALKAVQQHAEEVRTSGGLSEVRNLRTIAQIQRAVFEGAEVDLGPFANLDVVEPERISISMTQLESGDAILTPNFGTGDAVERIDARLGQIGPNEEGRIAVGDRIIILDKKKMLGVRELIANRRIRKEYVETFLKSPSAFVDAALVDLDVGFSARVKGATVFRLAYFGETEASENEWFGPEGEAYAVRTTNLSLPGLLKSSAQIDEFDERLEEAVSAGAEEFKFGDGKIFHIEDLDETRKLIREIRDKLDEAETPAPQDDDGRKDDDPADEPQPEERVVVDIIDNDETAVFDARWVPVNWKDALDTDEFDQRALALQPYAYQWDGIRWILGLLKAASNYPEDTKPACGAMLADDMGLGKTMMSLAAIGEYYRRCGDSGQTKRPVLVVAPLSLLDNWKDEVSKVFSSSPFRDIVVLQSKANLDQFRIAGARRETQQTVNNDGMAEINHALKVRAAGYEADALDQPQRLVLVTYQTLRDYMFSLCKVDWALVIFDEAQNIKNPNALQTRAAKGLKSHFSLAVTGTPVENELRDFWCLFDTARPGLMGSYQEFRRKYVAPIRNAERPDREVIRAQVGQELRKRAAGLMLRRLKEDQLEGLPEKRIWVGIENPASGESFKPELRAVMGGIQKDRYDMVIGVTRELIAEEDGRGAALKGLQALRAVSLHPDCIEGGAPRTPGSADAAKKEFEKSAKLSVMLNLLVDIRGRQEKVIIFCINKGLQRFLQISLEKIFGIPVHVINGDTKAVETARGGATRRKLIAEFESQAGFGVIVMSPIAAGVGLTVVGANNVIHLERHWNPAKENQATDRVYRIGQELPVNVYVPVAMHPQVTSFDENLARLLSRKIGLRDAVVTPDEVTPDEILNSGVFGAEVKITATPISHEMVRNMSWQDFEVLMAELLAREYAAETHLTPQSNDYGCDVVVLSSTGPCRLVQCKHTSHDTFRGHAPITEIVGARPYYQSVLGRQFDTLEVFTSARKFDRDAKSTAQASSVSLFGLNQIKKLLNKHGVTDADLMRRPKSRLKLSRRAAAS